MSAVFSPCKNYRWVLRRIRKDGNYNHVVFCGVNPSKAGAKINDPTIVRLQNFCDLWGYGELSVVNAFGLISSDPKTLALVDDPVGNDNDVWVREEFMTADLIVPMWGDTGKVPPHLRHRFDTIREYIRAEKTPCKVFGLTKHGHPQHPLYLGRNTELKEWTP